MITRSEFTEWKSHPVTKQVFQQLMMSEHEIKERLAMTAGEVPSTDRFLSGYIAALRDFYLIDFGGEE